MRTNITYTAQIKVGERALGKGIEALVSLLDRLQNPAADWHVDEVNPLHDSSTDISMGYKGRIVAKARHLVQTDASVKVVADRRGTHYEVRDSEYQIDPHGGVLTINLEAEYLGESAEDAPPCITKLVNGSPFKL